MSEALMNHMRRAAQEALGGMANTRHGIVRGYDPANYAVKVELQPEGVMTDWLALKSAWVGNGWGLYFAPSLGDWVEVDFQEADGDAGSAGLRFYTNQARPLPVPSGEAWLVHRSGASVKLTNDGALTLDSGAGAWAKFKGVNITSAGTWSHTGAITATGDVTANGTSLHTHKHSGVQAGSAQTGQPV
jgi:phage baseplate assembly protein gpV